MEKYLLDDQLFIYILSVFIFWIGCCMGSFLNVCVWRIPRGESVVSPPSHCPNCNRAIPIWFNVPIFAWLILRGKCFNCKISISKRYILMEILTGLLYLGVWWRVYHLGGDLGLLFTWLVLTSLLITLAMIDLDCRILPNKVTFLGIALGLICSVLFPLVQSFGVEGMILPFQGTILVPNLQLLTYNKFVFGSTAWSWGLANAFFGFFFGYVVLASFCEIGKLLWGKYKVSFSSFQRVTVTNDSVLVGDLEYKLNETLSRKSDKISVLLEEGKKLLIFHDRLELDGEVISLEKLPTNLMTNMIILPQEVMGYGDVKMLAMCGTFMGAEALVVVLFIACIMALSYGFVLFFLGKMKSRTALPFGLFIGLAAYIYIIL